MRRGRIERTVASAAWAAYGDALGFISELTDENGLLRRTRGRNLDHPMAWVRRIGGRQGVEVELPAGCYSDDTQLRLAVGRCIGTDGFDVEAFAKVELTVWPSYALGGGKGTKAAAANLSKENVTWYANTFKGWTDAGGNGAAMRVQPHVWAAEYLDDPMAYIPDVVRDAVCTHGSPVGILGAVLHAMFVAHAIDRGEVPSPDEAASIVRTCRGNILARTHDSNVDGIWMGLWEREAQIPFRQGWEVALHDARSAVEGAARWARQPHNDYSELLASLNLYSPAARGSGLLTSIAALALLWTQPDVERALVMSANAVGSDTDTIGTMAGALGGAVTSTLPRAEIVDFDLICSEAERLARLSQGQKRTGHEYPDLLHWVAPRTQADALVEQDGSMWVLGLGPVRPDPSGPLVNGKFGWQWVTTSYGQTLLAKRRSVLPKVHDAPARMRNNDVRDEGRANRSKVSTAVQPSLMGDDYTSRDSEGATEPNIEQVGLPLDRGVILEEVLRWLDSGRITDDQALGYALRRVARDGSPDQLLLLIGALRERLRS
jgi:ADP-ribosylglycohydrolase